MQDSRRGGTAEEEESLNRQAPQNPPHIVPAAEDLDVESGKLTRDEIWMAIRQLKHGKVDTETTVDMRRCG